MNCENCGMRSGEHRKCYTCERIEKLTKVIGHVISFAPSKAAEEGLKAVRQLAELATPEPEKMR